jgi:hypothetical protein
MASEPLEAGSVIRGVSEERHPGHPLPQPLFWGAARTTSFESELVFVCIHLIEVQSKGREYRRFCPAICAG